MENPATWNKLIKTLNNTLQYGHKPNVTADIVIEILSTNSFFIGDSLDYSRIEEAINKALLSFDYEMKNQCCGNTLGTKIYLNLKELGAVE